ncbi:sensory neuron membrane protein 2 isoform X2 [Toxorhynchites rutilus septentrionalis]|uniref:sensory neuron membrane protein 2 isoform X2 n=1 Tax=Toxorhynchites rutilus septentrionalis TaxID=329112 RepID=UPI00247ACD1D|nr:sensory neuron membrane protein 2 isoform X2 [Toxorhynchites rutilus septentrionalis]
MVQWTLVWAGIGVLIAISGALLGWIVFPAAVHEKIIENTELRQDTPQFKRWEVIPQPLDFKVYLFNVTNPYEVQMGRRPRVVEVGPYIYFQYRQKDNIRFSRDRTKVHFSQRQTYLFDAESSYPLTENDQITVLNMHMNSILQIAEDETYDSLRLINVELNRIFGRPDSMFLRTTPKEFLFDGVPFCVNVIGIAKAICKEIEKRNTKSVKMMPDGSMKFAFFNHKNMTDDGVYTVNTGIKDASQMHMIENWNGRTMLDKWSNRSLGLSAVCNRVYGTDGSGYPPFREGVQKMTIFSSDICRTVDIKYVGPSSYEGITAMRYETDNNFLHEIGPEYGNQCYCINQIPKAIVKSNGCLHRGALDLSACLDAPVVITPPHMMGVAEEYSGLIDGMHPDPDKHQIFVDVEPLTGTPLNGGKRVQFNMFLRRIDSIRLTDRLQTTLFPVLWIDEGIALNDDMVKLIDDSLMKVLSLLDIIQWCMIVIGLLLAIVLPVVYFVKRKSVPPPITPTLTTTTSAASIPDVNGLRDNPSK